MSKLKNIINDELQDIQLSDDIHMSVLNSKFTAKRKRFNFKPLVITIVSLCTVSMLTIGAGAVACGSVSEFINGVNILFEPINETQTDNGIKITVLSAGIDDVNNKTMSAYVTVEDTTDQDRINKDTSLSIFIEEENNTTDDEHSYIQYEMVSFDEDTKVATYKFVATMDWWHTFTNKNTIHINGISNTKITEKTVDNIDLYELAKDKLDSEYTYYDAINLGRYGYYGCYTYSSAPIRSKLLNENVEPIEIGENAELTAIGFIDGHLHVKVRYVLIDFATTDLETYISLQNIRLVNSAGEDVLNTSEYQSEITEYTTDYITDSDSQYAMESKEVCFPKIKDISQLEDLTIAYNEQSDENILGNWNITFTLDDISQE
ncbi:MAG: hypothetical protein LUG94_01295 [Ruminococcus sp.]|nr:hypothetical protein [Ruminococcus sp.]